MCFAFPLPRVDTGIRRHRLTRRCSASLITCQTDLALTFRAISLDNSFQPVEIGLEVRRHSEKVGFKVLDGSATVMWLFKETNRISSCPTMCLSLLTQRAGAKESPDRVLYSGNSCCCSFPAGQDINDLLTDAGKIKCTFGTAAQPCRMR